MVTAGLSPCKSWNGFSAEKCLVASPVKSLSDRLEYSKMDENVWEWEPPFHINVDDLDEFALAQLGERSAAMDYCSQLLDEYQENSDEEQVIDEDNQMECLDPVVCEQFGSVKKSLLPFLDEVSNSVAPPVAAPVKKNKWGPVVAARRSSRLNREVNVLEKAKEYQMKRNLEVPAVFKGKNVAGRAGHLEKGGRRLKPLADSLQGCSFRTIGKKRARAEQETRGASAHRLEMISKLPRVDDYEESAEERAALDAQQVELCKMLIVNLAGV